MASATPTPRNSAGFWQQTWLLFQKNFKTKRRQETKALLGEILVPILYLAGLSSLVLLYPTHQYPAQEVSADTPTSILENSCFTIDANGTYRPPANPPPLIIHIVPDNDFTQEFATLMSSTWKAQSSIKRLIIFEFYNSTAEVEDAYKNNTGINLALILPERMNTGGTFPYKIRVNPDLGLPAVTARMAPVTTCRQKLNEKLPLEKPTTCPVNGYFYWDFLAVQSLVNQAVLKLEGNSEARLDVTMENVPKREYKEGMPVFIRILVPLYSVIPLTQLINNILILIVTEKTTKVKDGLRMVGVLDGAYWLSWLGIYSIIVTIFSITFTGIFYSFGVLVNTSLLIVFLLFFLFGISMLVLAFALTPFFHKPKTAGLVAALGLQTVSLLFLVQTFFEGYERSLMPLKLISSLAFTTGIDQAGKYESSGGISWSDLYFGGRGEGVLTSLVFLAIDIILYAFLAFYLDNVIPNEFGVSKHPLFLFQPSFWTGSPPQHDVGNARSQYLANDGDGLMEYMNYEEVSPDMQGKEAIIIRNVRKTYTSLCTRKSVEAVKGISLDIYESQITAILGRNGAGKSTLFNILTGLVAPTSGSTTVFGLDSRRPYDMAKLRKILGVCLQQDLLFPSLTVEEHLKFYGKLRGLGKGELKQEIDIILLELKLEDSRTVRGELLSGGQMRKLSVGIALIGDPRVILLDEPSAGLDPVSRRNLWSLLQKKKEGKVILLTTHFMDEADVLADRKAIIHGGILRCVGSSLFLKNRFGVGYHLTVVLNESATTTDVSDAIIAKWIPQALDTRKLVAHEVKYALPHSESSKFASLLADFEAEIASGESILSFGVSTTTLEEVFLKISNDLDMERGSRVNFRNNGDTEEVDLIADAGPLNPTWETTFSALCWLRIKRLLRSPMGLIFMIVVPLIFTAGGFALAKTRTDSTTALSFANPTDVYKPDELRIAVSELGDHFKGFLNSSGINAIPYSGNFKDLLTVDPHGVMAAVDISDVHADPPSLDLTARIRANGTFLHAPVIVMDLLSKFLTSLAPDKAKVTPLLTYEPFRSLSKPVLPTLQASLFSVFLLGPAFAFSCTRMVIELVHDREIKARNHLRINGVGFTVYFLSIMAAYSLVSVVTVISQLALILVFQVEAFMNAYAMTILTASMLLYLIPSTIFNALFSYMFNRVETAHTVYGQVSGWGGTIVAFIVLIIDNVGIDRAIVRAVHIVLCAVDVFYIPYGIFYWIIKIYIEQKIQFILSGEEVEIGFSTYLTPEIVSALICMLVQIPVFWTLLVVADVVKNGGKPVQALRSLMKIHSPSIEQVESPDGENRNEDEDVTAERLRVIKYFSGAEPNNDCIVAVKNLRKKYKDKKKKYRQVLNGVNLMVEKGEVFGLLGHNGAGKTTTIRVITAEEAPDRGKVCLCGVDIKSSVSDAFSHLGFCPQHDALWENITLKEHLKLYARIRGVAKQNLKRLVDHFLKGLSIGEHAEKQAEKLSGGTRRKLSYGMAMLGAPAVVLLDEPSTGMDPQSKRFLWNTILGTFKESRGAVLTTHSMEEADILCTRIGITVKGRIICIGSPQHLKDKFGAGYTMEIKLNSDTNILTPPTESTVSSTNNVMVELISRRPTIRTVHSFENSPDAQNHPRKPVPSELRFITEHFPHSSLLEAFGNRAVFFIAKEHIQSISQTFAVLELLKSTHKIEEYSFSQTTLEQVFLFFAKSGEEGTEDAH